MRILLILAMLCVSFPTFEAVAGNPKVVAEAYDLDQDQEYTIQKKVKVNGQTRIERVAIRGPVGGWMLGVNGWADKLGFHVYDTVLLRDYANNGRIVYPARNIQVTIDGNFVRWKLDRGEIITSINDCIIESARDITLAIQLAPNKSQVPIEIYDPTSGDTVTGIFSAARTQK